MKSKPAKPDPRLAAFAEAMRERKPAGSFSAARRADNEARKRVRERK